MKSISTTAVCGTAMNVTRPDDRKRTLQKHALFTYVPVRMLQRSSFELQELHRSILAFKDGRDFYTRWAARQFAHALAAADLTDVVIACVPASSSYSTARRWKRFSRLLSGMTGAVDGFDRIQVCGIRNRTHVTGENELAADINSYVHIDTGFFRGRKVLVIDDIYTTGKSSDAFISAMESAGANVTMAMFLAKTMRYRG